MKGFKSLDGSTNGFKWWIAHRFVVCIWPKKLFVSC